MNKPLDQLTKAELITLLGMKQQELESKDKAIESRDKTIEYKDSRIEDLEWILAKFQKMLFGQKRERFESFDQLSLPFETPAEQQQAMQEELTEKVEYIRKKSGSSHTGRTKLPEHLPVEEIELYPEGNLKEMTCIGKEITEELDYKPAQSIAAISGINMYLKTRKASLR